MSDLDNDGWKDLLVTNGYQREVTNIDFINFEFAAIEAKGPIKTQFTDVMDFLNMIPQYKPRDFVVRNKGDSTFEDKSGEWMTMLPTWSNGAATADLDNDGDLDYVVNNIEDEAFVFRNNAAGTSNHHYIQFVAEGPVQNPFGIGLSVTIYQDSIIQYNLMTPGKGIFSAVEHLIHFGLGSDNVVDSVVIKWPDGKGQILTNIKGDQRIKIKYADATFNTIASKINSTSAVLFKDITSASGFNFKHIENQYIDFENTFLMPWSLSDSGPLTSVADVNQDSLSDIYIGNSFGKPKGLYVQSPDGKFKLVSEDSWVKDSLYEDHGSLFFDADMDGDMDLFVVSGGYESISPLAWQSRLYINDKGKFIHAVGAIPLLDHVCLRATSYDYDKDGDVDIFLGGRVVPGKYPVTPKSYILRNDRNKFVDATDEVAPAFRNVGMVTDLQFADINKDGTPELIVAGEWMPITIFKINKGKLDVMDGKSLGLDHSNGFWNKLHIADLDKDGDMDIVSGNLGLNTHYRASA